MTVRRYDGILFQAGTTAKTQDILTVEQALQVNINQEPYTVSMRTPRHDEALVRGLLHAEAVLEDVDYQPGFEIIESNKEDIVSVVNLSIDENKLGEGYSNSRSLLSVSSCGICGKTELSDLDFSGEGLHDSLKVDAELIKNLIPRMRSVQHGFSQSGGSHAAAAFDLKGALLCSMEDIGRHNAVDKVVGQLIIDNDLSRASVLTVSGRISYEIVIKCFKARIPILAAVSAPSSLAVDFAKELGITLFAFSRENRTTCYSHPERIKPISNTKSKAS